MQIPGNKLIQAAKICVLLSCLAIWMSGQEITSDKLTLARFEKHIADGKLSDIENDLLNYVIANPKDAKGFSLMAKLRLKQNRLSEAKSLSLKALTIRPEMLSAKLTLASAYFQLGETQQASALLDNISDSEIFDDILGLNLAQTYALVGNCAMALKTAEKLSLKIRDSDALPIRATCYLASGDNKKFDALIPLAKALTRRAPTVAVTFAEALSRAARYKEAADILRLVIAASPKNTDALLLLARSEVFLKDYANAKVHLDEIEKIRPSSSRMFFVKAILESEQGNNVRALDLLERSLVEDPNDTEVLGQFVVTAMRANQPGKAVRVAEKLTAQKPEDLESLYLYGAASLQNNDLENAEKALEKFLEARPMDSLGCLALGLTFAAQSDKLPQARRQLEKCLATNPDNFEAAYQLGLSYKTQGEATKAIEYLELAVKLSPDSALALRDLGAVYLQSGGETKARTVLEKSILLNPNDADTHFQLSRLYNLTGEPELAKKHLKIFQDLSKAKNSLM